MAKEHGHKNARQDLKALLEERNQQNAFLRAQLVARIEHTAHLEARLLSTLDTLGELQLSATRDIEQAQHDNARLIEKLDVCESIARTADREKSDMGSAVLQLVAKVESCNDYSNWRASRIEFSHDITLHPVRPAKISLTQPSRKNSEECTCAHAYSPAIVEELSDSLVREKRSHSLTIEEAEGRIAALQSRIAARDAEIARRMATCRCLPTSSTLDSSTHLELMSEEEQARNATRTAEMERELQSEVAVLEKKLKREGRSNKASRRADRSIQTDAATLRLPDPMRYYNPNTSAKPVFEGGYDAMPSALSALDSQIDHLRERLRDLVVEKESLRGVVYNELNVQDLEALFSHQRRRMAGQLERKDMDDREETKDRRESGFNDILLLEEECIRLMRSEESLCARLERLQQRDAKLDEENARLEKEISKLRSAETRTDYRPLLPPLETSAIDLAFPPLRPDTISPTYTHTCKGDASSMSISLGRTGPNGSSSSASSSCSPATPTSLIDPSEVPLPMTPTFDDAELEVEADDDHTSRETDESHADFVDPPSPQLPEETALPPRPDSLADTRNAEVVERDLADARADAEMREREIAEVRDLMADLASRVAGELQDR